jgi:hypothetical protein
MKAFGEASAHGLENGMNLTPPALTMLEPRQADGGPQFKRDGPLLASD